MADVFVWSGAGGAADGSKWEDAYLTLMKDWDTEGGFGAGTDFVYVRDSHDETNGADVTITGTTAEGTEDPVRVLCVTGNDTGTDPGTLSTGAEVNTNDTFDIRIEEKIYIYGVNFLSGELLWASSAGDAYIVLEQCRLELVGVAGTESIYLGASVTTGRQITLLDVDIDFAAAAQGLDISSSTILWDGGTLDFNVSNLIKAATPEPVNITVRNVDFSILTGNLVGAASLVVSHKISFERCLLHANTTLVNGTIDVPGNTVDFHLCQSGVDNDPAYQMKRQTYQGTVDIDTARYRTGGATDQERTNPYSWSMDTSTGSNVIELYEPLESPPIAGWTDGNGSTAHTYRIYIASGATLQNDEVWVDLIGPNDAATDSLGLRQTTRPDPLTAPANLTADGVSVWNGADVGTEQQIDITYTPDKPGPIVARVYFAKPSVQTRVSIDPKVYIDP